MKPLINTVLPVHNEEDILIETVGRLISFFESESPYRHELVIADNGSTDRTLEMSRELNARSSLIRVRHFQEKGRGRALKRTWEQSQADVLSYMDVDLSTDLGAFMPLIDKILSDGVDIAVGSRLLGASLIRRSIKREVLSRGYNFLIKILFQTHFSDAQCGFKAISKQAATDLLPLVKDDEWFMDSELLIVAEKLGYSVCDIPVRWVERSDSRVRIFPTVIGDMKGLVRVWRNLRRGQFAGRGVRRLVATNFVR